VGGEEDDEVEVEDDEELVRAELAPDEVVHDDHLLLINYPLKKGFHLPYLLYNMKS